MRRPGAHPALHRRTRGPADFAEIKGHSTHSQDPAWFTTAPIPAIRKLLDKVARSVGDVDFFEINEAFAAVAMAAQRSRHPARQAERQWGRLRARPPDRGDRCPPHRHAPVRARAAGPDPRRRVPLHRWRRGHGDRGRAAQLSQDGDAGCSPAGPCLSSPDGAQLSTSLTHPSFSEGLSPRHPNEETTAVKAGSFHSLRVGAAVVHSDGAQIRRIGWRFERRPEIQVSLPRAQG